MLGHQYGDGIIPGIGTVGPRQSPSNPTPKAASPPIQYMRWCRNGKHPNAATINMMSSAANQSVLYRTKEVFNMMAGRPDVMISSFGAGDRARWRFPLHTGPYHHLLFAMVVLAPQSAGFTYNAAARLDIENGAGAVVASQIFEGGPSPTGPVEALGFQYLKFLKNYVNRGTGTAADTDYYGVFYDVDYGRILSASVVDLQSMTVNFDGYLSQSLTTQTPVVDVFRENLATITRALWRRSGARVLSWTVDDQSTPRTRTSATPINVVDNTSTAISASTPGYTIDMTGKDRLSQTAGVPVVMKAYAKVSSGTAGKVSIYDSTSTLVAEISNVWTNTAAWQSVSFNLPATEDKYDIQFSSPDGFTFSLYSLGIYEHET